MGEIALAAKITHVPSMFISELDGPNKGCRQAAIDGLAKIGDRIRELGVDTVIVADTHWLVNAGYHTNGHNDASQYYAIPDSPAASELPIWDLETDAKLARFLGTGI